MVVLKDHQKQSLGKNLTLHDGPLAFDHISKSVGSLRRPMDIPNIQFAGEKKGSVSCRHVRSELGLRTL